MMLKLPFGLQNGRLLHVSEVERGLKCNCVCPSCSEPLVAKKGSKIVHHFSHTNAGCQYGLETALHLAAKDILQKAKRIYLPQVVVKFQSYKKPWLLTEGGYYDINHVLLEKKINDFIPDVIAVIRGRRLLIEIAVTHPVDDLKRIKIEKAGISAIEIQLDQSDNNFTKDILTKQIIDQNEEKKWIVNFKAKKVIASMSRHTKAYPIVERGMAIHVDYCPQRARVWRGKPYANVIDDCWYCEYCINSTGHFIYCSGHRNIKSYEDYLRVNKSEN